MSQAAISEVVNGGSMGNNTTVSGYFDVDLIIYSMHGGKLILWYMVFPPILLSLSNKVVFIV